MEWMWMTAAAIISATKSTVNFGHLLPPMPYVTDRDQGWTATACSLLNFLPHERPTMATLHIGKQCQTCNLVDFLPFTCPHCSGTFCKEHVHHHGCSDLPSGNTPAAESSRKRIKGICALPGCESETIESLGGYEDTATEGGKASDEDIARQVRCKGCQQAFCLA